MFKRLQLSCAAVCLSFGTTMAADLEMPAVEQYSAPSPYYLSLHGGLTLPDDSDIEFELQGQSEVPGEARNENGFRVGGALGYNLSEMLSGEVEVSYSNSDVSSIYAGGVFDTTVPTDGDGSLLTIMGNLVIGQHMGAWRPYIGAGAGAANVDLQVTGFGSGVDDDDWTWAVQGFAGADFSLSENMTLGGRYRYQHIGSTDYSDGNGLPIKIDDAGIHSIEAVLTLNFGR